MDQTASRSATPVSFWIVAVLSAFWNGFGAYDYIMTRMRDVAYLDGVTNGKGQAMLQWLDSQSVIVQVGWPLGIWGSVAGSLLLLLRSRHAATAFLLSLVGAVVSMGLEYAQGIPSDFSSTAQTVMTLVILVVIVALWRYSRSATAKGILR